MDWSYIATAGVSTLGGAFMAFCTVYFYAQRQRNAIAAEQASVEQKQRREQYEFEQIRKSDAYKELTQSINELRVDREDCRRKIVSQDEHIEALVRDNVECLINSGKLEAKIANQAMTIDFLERRVKILESMILPQQATKLEMKAEVVAENLVSTAKVVAKELEKNS